MKVLYAGIVGLFCLVVSQPAFGENQQETRSKTSAAYLLTQDTTPVIVQITGVRLQKTAAGLKLILETPNSTLQVADSLNEGNIYIADIANAILKLPEGKEWSADNPTEGITSIRVTQLESNNH
ncbi:MAG: AMIN domain-containing protein [Nostocales cyanobacterium 94392]|nr:AMIN domain-containing protein [Nostocales cyanobacterium 94392]